MSREALASLAEVTGIPSPRMRRLPQIPTLIFALVLPALAGCQGDKDTDPVGEEGDSGDEGPTPNDPCGACPPGGYAVDCGVAWGVLGEDYVCGINQDNAEFLCLSMTGGTIKSSPSDECPLSPLVVPWDPASSIHRDRSGTIIIQTDLLDRLEERPRDIYLDATRVDWDEDGRVVISTAGQLATALGLTRGDVLIEVNGYAFSDLLDTPGLYSELRDTGTLTLDIERSGRSLTLEYRLVE